MKLKRHATTVMCILTIQFFHSNEGANIAYQLKEASEIDANATPPTIGRRDKTTQGVGSCMAIHVSEQDEEIS